MVARNTVRLWFGEGQTGGETQALAAQGYRETGPGFRQTVAEA
ncbi:hypothetical protein PSAL_015610 [Pseudooceanicola algae]|uniref:Uncharacterized protein n=1 Tax=Pseudooceanicola algae TaxID=1537215 RepID=A0A418SH86_9RHOB|nr:hypothetical protein PSAL_015610 [Pseudooceanicola algae]